MTKENIGLDGVRDALDGLATMTYGCSKSIDAIATKSGEKRIRELRSVSSQLSYIEGRLDDLAKSAALAAEPALAGACAACAGAVDHVRYIAQALDPDDTLRSTLIPKNSIPSPATLRELATRIEVVYVTIENVKRLAGNTRLVALDQTVEIDVSCAKCGEIFRSIREAVRHAVGNPDHIACNNCGVYGGKHDSDCIRAIPQKA